MHFSPLVLFESFDIPRGPLAGHMLGVRAYRHSTEGDIRSLVEVDRGPLLHIWVDRRSLQQFLQRASIAHVEGFSDELLSEIVQKVVEAEKCRSSLNKVLGRVEALSRDLESLCQETQESRESVLRLSSLLSLRGKELLLSSWDRLERDARHQAFLCREELQKYRKSAPDSVLSILEYEPLKTTEALQADCLAVRKRAESFFTSLKGHVPLVQEVQEELRQICEKASTFFPSSFEGWYPFFQRIVRLGLVCDVDINPLLKRLYTWASCEMRESEFARLSKEEIQKAVETDVQALRKLGQKDPVCDRLQKELFFEERVSSFSFVSSTSLSLALDAFRRDYFQAIQSFLHRGFEERGFLKKGDESFFEMDASLSALCHTVHEAVSKEVTAFHAKVQGKKRVLWTITFFSSSFQERLMPRHFDIMVNLLCAEEGRITEEEIANCVSYLKGMPETLQFSELSNFLRRIRFVSHTRLCFSPKCIHLNDLQPEFYEELAAFNRYTLVPPEAQAPREFVVRYNLKVQEVLFRDIQLLGLKLPKREEGGSFRPQDIRNRDDFLQEIVVRNSYATVLERFEKTPTMRVIELLYETVAEPLRLRWRSQHSNLEKIRRVVRKKIQQTLPYIKKRLFSEGAFKQIFEIRLFKGKRERNKALAVMKHTLQRDSRVDNEELCFECARSEEFRDGGVPNVLYIQKVDLLDPSENPVELGGLMDFCEGRDLEDLLLKQQRPLSLFERTTLALEVARAVEGIHKMHLCHGDLKPENVCIRYDSLNHPHAFLSDFSFVSQMGERKSIQGTNISPEQFEEYAHGRRENIVTEQMDLWCLADILTSLRGKCLFPCKVKRLYFDEIFQMQKEKKTVREMRERYSALARDMREIAKASHEDLDALNAELFDDTLPPHRPSAASVVERIELAMHRKGMVVSLPLLRFN